MSIWIELMLLAACWVYWHFSSIRKKLPPRAARLLWFGIVLGAIKYHFTGWQPGIDDVLWTIEGLVIAWLTWGDKDPEVPKRQDTGGDS